MTTMTTPTESTDAADRPSAGRPSRATPPQPTPDADRSPVPVTTRPMPPLVHDEPAGYRWAWLAVGLAVTALFAVVVFRFYAPADSGVDQNAYLTAGRLLAENGTPKYVLPNPFAYTGGMFVRMPTGVYYPKYSLGLPLLYAAFFKLFGPDRGPVWAFLVSPASAVAAVLGTFFLARAVAGSFAAVLAAALLGTSQVMLSLADNPNSHASCTAVTVWGMFLLVRWWQTGSVWQGTLAGLLIGYAFTIRYTEGLLVIPVAVACLTRLRWRHWTPWVLASAVGALGIAFELFINLWTDGSADGLRGYHYWFGPGRTGHTLEALGAYSYAVALVPAFVMAAASLQRTAGWNRFVADTGWDQWRGWAEKPAAAAVALAGVWVAVNTLFLAPTWSAIADPHQWTDGPRGALTALSVVGVTLALTVGAWSALAAGVRREWIGAFARNVVPGLAWCVPVAALVIYNSATMRHAAGYDTTHESELGVAFQWKFLVRNWEMVVRTFDDLELFFVVPFALAGLALVFRRSWRVGVLLLAWLVPGVLLYTSYYWSMEFDVAYARFYLTFLPALCVAAAVAFHDGILGGRVGGTGTSPAGAWRHWAPAVQVLAAAAVVAAVVLGLQSLYHGGWETGSDLGLHPFVGTQRTTAEVVAVGLTAAAVLAVAGLAYRSRPSRTAWAALAARVPSAIAVALVVGVATGVSAYRGLHGLRDGTVNLIPLIENYRTRLNLATVGQVLLGKHYERPPGQARGWQLVDNVPAGSLLFSSAGGGIQSPSNYIQFLRNWDLIPSDAFTEDGSRRGFGGGGGNRNRRPGNNANGNNGPGNNGNGGNGNGRGGFMGFGRGNGGPPGGPGGGGPGGPNGGGPPGMGGGNGNDDQDTATATPIQPEQQDFHAGLYRGKSARQLHQFQAAAIRRAFDSHQRVFVVVDKEGLENFEDNLDQSGTYASSGKYDLRGKYGYRNVAAWSDVALPVDRDEDAADDKSNRWGGGRFNNRRGGGANNMGGPGMARLFGLSGQLNEWRLVEVLPGK